MKAYTCYYKVDVWWCLCSGPLVLLFSSGCQCLSYYHNDLIDWINSPAHYIMEESIFDFRYVSIYDVDSLKEKWLNYLQTVETLIRGRVLWRLIWVCTVCQSSMGRFALHLFLRRFIDWIIWARPLFYIFEPVVWFRVLINTITQTGGPCLHSTFKISCF